MAWLPIRLLFSCHHPVAAGSLVLLDNISTMHTQLFCPYLLGLQGLHRSLWEIEDHHGQENYTLGEACASSV